MDVERGAQRVARVMYEAKENGFYTILGNALFGAIQYQNPQGYQDILRARSESDPALRKTLAELGSTDNRFTEKDFEYRYQTNKEMLHQRR